MDHKRLFNNLYILVVLWNLMIIFSFIVYYNITNEKTKIEIHTATKGGKYHQVGDKISEFLNSSKEFQSRTVETDGSIDNLEHIVHFPKNLIALVYSSANENNALARFADLEDNIKDVSSIQYLYHDILQIVYNNDKGIDSIRDLKHKKVYLGKPKSGTRYIAERMLKTCDLTKDSLDQYKMYDNLSYEQAADALIKRDLDAAFFFSGLPTKAIENALEYGHLKLLTLKPNVITKFTNANSSYTKFSGESYIDHYHEENENYYIDKNFRSVNSHVMLATNVASDSEVIFKILRIINDKKNIKELTNIVPEIMDHQSFFTRQGINDVAEKKAKLHKGSLNFLEKRELYSFIYSLKQNSYILITLVIISLFFIQLFLLFKMANYKINPDNEIITNDVKFMQIVIPPVIAGIISIIIQLLM